jgi:hypothetical protein
MCNTNIDINIAVQLMYHKKKAPFDTGIYNTCIPWREAGGDRMFDNIELRLHLECKYTGSDSAFAGACVN